MSATDTQERIEGARAAFAAIQAELTAQWEQCKADARRHGLTARQVESFRCRQRLGFDAPLSADAAALLRQELETTQRCKHGEQLEQAQALALLAQRATPEAAAAIAAVVPFPAQFSMAGTWVWGGQIEAYLLNRLEALTGKRYATPAAAIKRAAALAPAAAAAAAGLESTGRRSTTRTTAERLRLCLFWGAILRLDQLEGPPPADPAAFYRWCQLEAYASHGSTPTTFLGDLLAGRMGETQARALLQLPPTGPLAAAGIRSAYRTLAREHHPDAGGDRLRFERLSAARDRLLLTAQEVTR